MSAKFLHEVTVFCLNSFFIVVEKENLDGSIRESAYQSLTFNLNIKADVVFFKKKFEFGPSQQCYPYPLNMIDRRGLNTTFSLVSFLFSRLSYTPKPSFQLLLQDVLLQFLSTNY